MENRPIKSRLCPRSGCFGGGGAEVVIPRMLDGGWGDCAVLSAELSEDLREREIICYRCGDLIRVDPGKLPEQDEQRELRLCDYVKAGWWWGYFRVTGQEV